MKRLISLAALIASATTLGAPFASAHATLEQQSAELGTTYKAVVRVGHGCDGQATKKVTVTIPEGVIAVKPMPKAGWTLSTEVAAYAQTYDYHGPISEGVTQIIWEGSLEDAHYDEFVFRGRLDKSLGEGVVYFPVVQTCDDGENAWVEIPAKGQDPHDLEGPAPGLTLTHGHDHGHAH